MPQLPDPPQCTEIEQDLLGALMLHNESFFTSEVARLCPAVSFGYEAHREIARVMYKILEEGGKASPLIVIAQFAENTRVGSTTLRHYVQTIILREHGGAYFIEANARTVRDYFLRRQLYERMLSSLEVLASGALSTAVSDLVEVVEESIFDVRDALKSRELRSVGEAAISAVAATEKAKRGEMQGYSFANIQSLDEMIGLLIPGDVFAIAAPSGAGKTAIGTEFLLQNLIADDADRVGLMLQMEMRAEGIAQRVMARSGIASVKAQRAGKLSDMELAKLKREAESLRAIPLLIDDSGRQTLRTIRSQIHAAKRKYDIGVVMIDHLQLIAPEENGKIEERDIDTIRKAVVRLKEIAKENQVVLIVLSQLTRGSQREMRHWRFSDQAIYGGDQLRQNCDIMLGITSPADWLEMREPGFEDYKRRAEDETSTAAKIANWRGYVEIGALKMRDGEHGGWKRIRFDGARQTFED